MLRRAAQGAIDAPPHRQLCEEANAETLFATARSRCAATSVDRQPDRVAVRRCPGNPVTQMAWQVDQVARGEHNLPFALDLETRRARYEQDELVLLLVVPEARRRGVPVRDDTLDAHPL